MIGNRALTGAERDRRYYLKHRSEILLKKKSSIVTNPQKEKARRKLNYVKHRSKILADKKLYQIAKREIICATRKQHYHANRSRLLEEKRLYWAANREALNEKQNEKRANPEIRKKLREREKNWRAPRLNEIAKKARERRKSNPQWYQKYYAKHKDSVTEQSKKRRAVKRGAIIGDTSIIKGWEKRWKRKVSVKCYWCLGKFSPTVCHSDHIMPLAKGGPHSIDNLCISCAPCNLSKNGSDPDKWNSKLSQPALSLFIERKRGDEILAEA